MRKNCFPSGFNRVPLIIETYINGVSVDRGQNKLILNPLSQALRTNFDSFAILIRTLEYSVGKYENEFINITADFI